jgi:hypothetical protein
MFPFLLRPQTKDVEFSEYAGTFNYVVFLLIMTTYRYVVEETTKITMTFWFLSFSNLT